MPTTPAAAPPYVVALLAMPDVSASTLYGFHDALSGAGRDWQLMHGKEASSPFRPLVVSRDGAPMQAANGVRIQPDCSFADCPPPDVVCVTDVLVAPDAPLDGRYDLEVAWLRERHDAGALLAAACSGALLLARTGLLDGLEATTHWAYCDALQRQHPNTRWQAERGLVVAGEEKRRIVTSGSGVSWHQLVLYLVARYAGATEAMQVARINLLDLNTTSATVYASLTHGTLANDPLINRCQEWAALNYHAESPVTQMVALAGLPERSFKRRFTQATGPSPLDYVHTLRLEEAKQLLESGDLPVEAIAHEVGYQDASFFSRLFRRKVALTPAQYRRRFQPLAQRLRSAGAATKAVA